MKSSQGIAFSLSEEFCYFAARCRIRILHVVKPSIQALKVFYYVVVLIKVVDI